jgi:hypothetical protein
MGTLKTHPAKLHQKNYYKPTWRKSYLWLDTIFSITQRPFFTIKTTLVFLLFYSKFAKTLYNTEKE